MDRGLFACAPNSPHLAVDIRLLSLARQVFFRLSPNVTGWCDASEALLNERGFEFLTKVRVLAVLQCSTLISSAT